MSIDRTLAERGNRYGDFTDHAAICQRIKMAMIHGRSKWTALPDTHKQALEVIADKIARILSGDPDYADNWHDIQGYAKLVEDRLPGPVAPVAQAEESEWPDENSPRNQAVWQNGNTGEHYDLQVKCNNCGEVMAEQLMRHVCWSEACQ